MRLKKWMAAVALLALLLAPTIYAQQINTLTQGTGGVGRLVVGVGSANAVTIANQFTTLTNAQVLALHNTPVTVISDPGDGFVIDVIDGMMMFNYGGTAYTAGGGDDLRLYYTNRGAGPSASNVIEATGFLTATADTIIAFSGTTDDTLVTASAPVVLQNSSSVAFGGGNAANQVNVSVTYVIRRTGL